MTKLYFFYSTMNAGKTTSLLQFNHTCIKKNINTLIFITNIIKKQMYVESRIGIKNAAIPIYQKTNIFKYIKKYRYMIKNILIDEAQFLSKKHIFELTALVDNLKINVYTYGLKTDFKLKFFKGSKYLLLLADIITSLEALCKCGNNAIANVKINNQGKKIKNGKKINLNKKLYIPTCRYHYFKFKNLK